MDILAHICLSRFVPDKLFGGAVMAGQNAQGARAVPRFGGV